MQEASSRSCVTGDDATGDQWGGQQVDVVQVGHAESATSQHDALLTGAGSHSAIGHASAGGTVAVDQWIAAGRDGRRRRPRAVGRPAHARRAGCRRRVDRRPGRDGAARASTGGTASASASAGGLALVDQAAEQTAVRSRRRRASQTAAQLVFVGQDAFAHATTAQQAGTAGSPARIERGNRRRPGGCRPGGVAGGSRPVRPRPSGDLLQQSIVVQTATAVSTSNGGIGGSAVVVNCAVTQQGAAQSIGAGAASVSSADLTAFCFSPEPARSVAGPRACSATVALRGRVSRARDANRRWTTSRPCSVAAAERQPPRSGPRTARPRTARPRTPGWRRSQRSTGDRRSGRPVTTQFSALHSTQARLDTRPGSYAGAGDAGREPPLPPAGDPPTWISALAAAASGAGSIGDRSDPPGLRARAAAPAASAGRVGRQATDRRSRTNRRSGLTLSPHATDLLGPGSTGKCLFGCDERK